MSTSDRYELSVFSSLFNVSFSFFAFESYDRMCGAPLKIREAFSCLLRYDVMGRCKKINLHSSFHDKAMTFDS